MHLDSLTDSPNTLCAVPGSYFTTGQHEAAARRLTPRPGPTDCSMAARSDDPWPCLVPPILTGGAVRSDKMHGGGFKHPPKAVHYTPLETHKPTHPGPETFDSRDVQRRSAQLFRQSFFIVPLINNMTGGTQQLNKCLNRQQLRLKNAVITANGEDSSG